MRTAALLTAVALSLLCTLPASAVGPFDQSSFFDPTTESGTTLPSQLRAHHGGGMIVVPLTDGAFGSMVDAHSPVAFDFDGAGNHQAKGWLTSDAAWLVWDPNWRGDIRSGADMIGERTWSVVWSNGFDALRTRDANHDGRLTGDELAGLALWCDANADGVSEPEEVMPVEAHGIVSISTRAARSRPGLLTAPDGVRFDNGRSRPLYDWIPGGQPGMS